MKTTDKPHVVIIGAGFCGLSAGFELAKHGLSVTILEKDAEIGGLAGSFLVEGVQLEKFYHHWFTNDLYIMNLIKELGTEDQVLFKLTNTGMYYANNFFKLSTPLDVLRFKPLSFIDRIRLGLLVLRARRVQDWRELEEETAEQWLKKMGGQKVYNVVWEPLLRGKFGEVASEISAVWFCNKLKLRGGSRGKGGEEQLAYYRGGFAALADQLKEYIELKGGQVITDAPIKELIVNAGQVVGVRSGDITFHADAVIATPALPIIANLVEPHVSADYTQRLRRIRYLGNACLVLELDRSLSNTYWLNVNDPGFPFVGVIEHTNFESVNTYGGRHIVYLSKYLPVSDALFQMSDEDLLEYTIPYLQEMFPAFHRNWILKYHIWKAHYSQPIVERRYSRLIPKKETPLQGLYIATMAQIYPEDRGTNYAVREGRLIGKRLIANISKKTISEGLCERHDV